jgi:3-hydroxy-9,10-secoandrosta-1,3,5(10)-triene-9,17-dione monooxygenase reductase component
MSNFPVVGRGDGVRAQALPALARSRPAPGSQALRDVLGTFTTGVTVVSCRLPDRRPLGVTANSFTSVSLDPPLVLVCLRRSGRSGRAIVDAGVFAVNVLQARQQGAAAAFSELARSAKGDLWSWTASGVPVLKQSLATIICAVHEVIEGGDHDIIVGAVRDASCEQQPCEPLIYYRGQYRSLSPLEQ